MSVTSRPNAAAPVTILPSTTQFTAQFVWPVTTTSTSSSIASTIGGSAPLRVPQLLIVVSLSGLDVEPPSWSRTTIVSTPCAFSWGTSAFTVAASSRKSTCETPPG